MSSSDVVVVVVVLAVAMTPRGMVGVVHSRELIWYCGGICVVVVVVRYGVSLFVCVCVCVCVIVMMLMSLPATAWIDLCRILLLSVVSEGEIESG